MGNASDKTITTIRRKPSSTDKFFGGELACTGWKIQVKEAIRSYWMKALIQDVGHDITARFLSKHILIDVELYIHCGS